MFLLYEVDVLISAKVVIFLKKYRIVFILVKVKNCFEVFLVEVFVLEFTKDDVSFFGFPEPRKKYIEIMLNLLWRFWINLWGNALHIFDWPSFERFYELIIVFETPIAESLTDLLVKFVF